MDVDFDQAAALRGIYRSAPGGAWRLYRRELALLLAGEAALFSRTWGRWGQYNGLRRGVAQPGGCRLPPGTPGERYATDVLDRPD